MLRQWEQNTEIDSNDDNGKRKKDSENKNHRNARDEGKDGLSVWLGFM